MAAKVPTTRKQILNMLKFQGKMSVSEMASQLSITEMAVRRHLNTLERDGLIYSTLVRQSMGRPTNMYMLTDTADDLFPKNYYGLTLELLEDLANTEGKKVVDELFVRRKERMTEANRHHIDGELLEERVEQLAELQNSKGYMVKWDKISEGKYRVVEHNCPIARVANKFNQACACELSYFRDILGDAATVVRPECKSSGDANCVYVIEEKTVEKAKEA
ncbi:helix-turn-helix transcriptional regulator [Numidum massiliense]|uniref:helix-turn-helix transcriptional regulator n=1 Tax=Numidum massiliense TaxID=1522315 RepID=UPI0006D53711|nr:metalloregulator ArsR/SmtB family transcription factor [Numidum massiliense]